MSRKCQLGTQFCLQLSAPYTDHTPSNSPPLEPQTLVPSSKCIKAYCESANHKNYHVWSSHHQHAARLLQITQYKWLSQQLGGFLVYPIQSNPSLFHVFMSIYFCMLSCTSLLSFMKLPIELYDIDKFVLLWSGLELPIFWKMVR